MRLLSENKHARLHLLAACLLDLSTQGWQQGAQTCYWKLHACSKASPFPHRSHSWCGTTSHLCQKPRAAAQTLLLVFLSSFSFPFLSSPAFLSSALQSLLVLGAVPRAGCCCSLFPCTAWLLVSALRVNGPGLFSPRARLGRWVTGQSQAAFPENSPTPATCRKRQTRKQGGHRANFPTSPRLSRILWRLPKRSHS